MNKESILPKTWKRSSVVISEMEAGDEKDDEGAGSVEEEEEEAGSVEEEEERCLEGDEWEEVGKRESDRRSSDLLTC